MEKKIRKTDSQKKTNNSSRGGDGLVLRPSDLKEDSIGCSRSESASTVSWDSNLFGRSALQTRQVINGDDRVRVPNTARSPWNWICQLEIMPWHGKFRVYGTGWLIGRRTVITAGHCVFSAYREDGRETGQRDYAAWIRVTPGMSGSSTPFNAQVSSRTSQFSPFRTTAQWRDSMAYHDADIGAIFLDEPFTDQAGTEIGYFGLQSEDDDFVRKLLLNVAGYPGEDRTTQYFHRDKPKELYPTYFTYTIDTTGGQSGAPVFYMHPSEEKYYVVGIHTSAWGQNRNHAVRVDDSAFDLIMKWRDAPT